MERSNKPTQHKKQTGKGSREKGAERTESPPTAWKIFWRRGGCMLALAIAVSYSLFSRRGTDANTVGLRSKSRRERISARCRGGRARSQHNFQQRRIAKRCVNTTREAEFGEREAVKESEPERLHVVGDLFRIAAVEPDRGAATTDRDTARRVSAERGLSTRQGLYTNPSAHTSA